MLHTKFVEMEEEKPKRIAEPNANIEDVGEFLAKMFGDILS